MSNTTNTICGICNKNLFDVKYDERDYFHNTSTIITHKCGNSFHFNCIHNLCNKRNSCVCPFCSSRLDLEVKGDSELIFAGRLLELFIENMKINNQQYVLEEDEVYSIYNERDLIKAFSTLMLKYGFLKGVKNAYNVPPEELIKIFIWSSAYDNDSVSGFYDHHDKMNKLKNIVINLNKKYKTNVSIDSFDKILMRISIHKLDDISIYLNKMFGIEMDFEDVDAEEVYINGVAFYRDINGNLYDHKTFQRVESNGVKPPTEPKHMKDNKKSETPKQPTSDNSSLSSLSSFKSSSSKSSVKVKDQAKFMEESRKVTESAKQSLEKVKQMIETMNKKKSEQSHGGGKKSRRINKRK